MTLGSLVFILRERIDPAGAEIMRLLHVLTLFSFCSLTAYAFTNPIKATDGSDPFMVYSNDYYYLTTTTWTNIQITRGTSMAALKTATPKVVWSDTTASRCCNMWAPEIHWIAGQSPWFIYYTAGVSGTFDGQHLHVLKGSSTDIWESTRSYAGRIAIPNRDVWAIDVTVLSLSSGPYLVFSSWDGDEQCLWISKMNSATSVGDAVKISSPTNSWEQVGANSKTTQSSSPSGNIYIVYHASPTSSVTCDGNRRTMVQAVGWNSDGTPNLGEPRAPTDSVPEPA
ncbi:hypothetical protein RSAG8_08899, partial [Rhizoctonia solani AG-8 WAC10335]